MTHLFISSQEENSYSPIDGRLFEKRVIPRPIPGSPLERGRGVSQICQMNIFL